MFVVSNDEYINEGLLKDILSDLHFFSTNEKAQKFIDGKLNDDLVYKRKQLLETWEERTLKSYQQLKSSIQKKMRDDSQTTTIMATMGDADFRHNLHVSGTIQWEILFRINLYPFNKVPYREKDLSGYLAKLDEFMNTLIELKNVPENHQKLCELAVWRSDVPNPWTIQKINVSQI
jgi:hypothetical protein